MGCRNRKKILFYFWFSVRLFLHFFCKIWSGRKWNIKDCTNQMSDNIVTPRQQITFISSSCNLLFDYFFLKNWYLVLKNNFPKSIFNCVFLIFIIVVFCRFFFNFFYKNFLYFFQRLQIYISDLLVFFSLFYFFNKIDVVFLFTHP